MSRFFVGQRVRVKWCMALPELGGRETRITGPMIEFFNAFTGRESEGYPVELHPNFYPAPHQLEPILPEGAAPSEFTTLADLLSSLSIEVPA